MTSGHSRRDHHGQEHAKGTPKAEGWTMAAQRRSPKRCGWSLPARAKLIPLGQHKFARQPATSALRPFESPPPFLISPESSAAATLLTDHCTKATPPSPPLPSPISPISDSLHTWLCPSILRSLSRSLASLASSVALARTKLSSSTAVLVCGKECLLTRGGGKVESKLTGRRTVGGNENGGWGRSGARVERV